MTYIELLMLLKLKLNIIVQALVVVFFAEVMYSYSTCRATTVP